MSARIVGSHLAKESCGTNLSLIHSNGTLIFCMEGTAVKSFSSGRLSNIEKEVIAELHALRASPGSDLSTDLIENPARLVHHFILSSHGNVSLRIATIARELGVGMRTLEGAFASEYNQTMSDCQLENRLKFSQWMLSIFPPTKISVIAVLLGYERVQDFNRFFAKHTGQSPSQWGRRKRARIAHNE